MSADEKPEDEAGGLSNEPLPGSGGAPGQPETPGGEGAPQPPQPPAVPAGDPAPPAQPAGTPPPPPPPPATPPAAPAAGTPAPAGTMVASGPGQPGMAIASFVCGLVGILLVWCCGFGGLLSIAAIVTGILAKGEVERRGAPSWMWITGVVLGAIGLVILLIWAIAVGINFSTNPNWDVQTS